jgi:hypothetical protein
VNIRSAHSIGKIEVKCVSLAEALQRFLQRGSTIYRHGIAARIVSDLARAGRVGGIATHSNRAAGPSAPTTREANASTTGPAAAAIAAPGAMSPVSTGIPFEFVWCLQETEDGIGAGEGAFHTRLIFIILCVIVGKDYNGASGVGPCVFMHVIRRSHKRTRNARAAAKIFRTQNMMQRADDIVVTAAERKLHMRIRVEDHDGNAILISQHS